MKTLLTLEQSQQLFLDYLRHERSLNETIALVKQRTRQFAKRQMTWFRREAGVTSGARITLRLRRVGAEPGRAQAAL